MKGKYLLFITAILAIGAYCAVNLNIFSDEASDVLPESNVNPDGQGDTGSSTPDNTPEVDLENGNSQTNTFTFSSSYLMSNGTKKTYYENDKITVIDGSDVIQTTASFTYYKDSTKPLLGSTELIYKGASTFNDYNISDLVSELSNTQYVGYELTVNGTSYTVDKIYSNSLHIKSNDDTIIFTNEQLPYYYSYVSVAEYDSRLDGDFSFIGSYAYSAYSDDQLIERVYYSHTTESFITEKYTNGVMVSSTLNSFYATYDKEEVDPDCEFYYTSSTTTAYTNYKTFFSEAQNVMSSKTGFSYSSAYYTYVSHNAEKVVLNKLLSSSTVSIVIEKINYGDYKFFSNAETKAIYLARHYQPLIDATTSMVGTTSKSWFEINAGTSTWSSYLSDWSFIGLLDTSHITDMSYAFSDHDYMKELPYFDTSSVENFTGIFYQCTGLVSVSDMDTSNATNVMSMFEGCTSLVAAPELNTSKVENFYEMFYLCTSLVDVPLFDTRNATSVHSMFEGCSSIVSLPEFVFENCTIFTDFLDGCSKLESIHLFDTSQATSISSMFAECTSLTTVPAYDFSNATSVSFLFDYCSSITELPALDLSKASSVNQTFRYMTSLVALPALDLSGCSMFANAFYGNTSLVDASKVITSDAMTYLDGMFYGCTSLEVAPEMDTVNVYSIKNLFYNCKSLISTPDYDFSKVTLSSNYSGCITNVPFISTPQWYINLTS